jgi:hypothetical protein
MSRRRICLILFLLLLGRGLFAPGNAMPTARAQTSRTDLMGTADEDPFASFSPQETFGSRFLHKSLPPLTRQETIIWSFRTADSSPFQ